MKRLAQLTFIVLLGGALISCARSRLTETDKLLQSGDKIGEMVIRIGRDESGEPSIFNYCYGEVTEADPSVIVRECTVPKMDYLFIGGGIADRSTDKLDSGWERYNWEMYLDGQAINLSTFGIIDTKSEDYILRKWNIAIENPTTGVHTLRYVITDKDGSGKFTDMTTIFTIGEQPGPISIGNGTSKITYPALSSTPHTGQHPYTSQGQLNFLLYVPKDYGKDALQRWPVILFLHGTGARLDNLEYVRGGGLPKALESRTDFPFIVISPQLIGGAARDHWSQPVVVELLFSLLEEVQTNLSVDPSRLYLTGISLGGEGTWEIGLKYPGHFAALVPVAGYYGWPHVVPANICDLKDEPIWAFHGAKDAHILLDAEQGLVDALKACGGNVQLTVYADGGHDIWDQAYATPELYNWMLSQVLK